MKFDFNKPVLDLDGKAIEGTNLSKILANHLSNANKGDAIKFFENAVILNRGEPIELDTSDQDVFEKFIKDNEQLPNITKAQLLFVFKNTREKQK